MAIIEVVRVPSNLKVDGNNPGGEKWKDFLSSRFGEREAASVSFAKWGENASKEVKISSSSGSSVDETYQGVLDWHWGRLHCRPPFHEAETRALSALWGWLQKCDAHFFFSIYVTFAFSNCYPATEHENLASADICYNWKSQLRGMFNIDYIQVLSNIFFRYLGPGFCIGSAVRSKNDLLDQLEVAEHCCSVLRQVAEAHGFSHSALTTS